MIALQSMLINHTTLQNKSMKTSFIIKSLDCTSLPMDLQDLDPHGSNTEAREQHKTGWLTKRKTSTEQRRNRNSQSRAPVPVLMPSHRNYPPRSFDWISIQIEGSKQHEWNRLLPKGDDPINKTFYSISQAAVSTIYSCKINMSKAVFMRLGAFPQCSSMTELHRCNTLLTWGQKITTDFTTVCLHYYKQISFASQWWGVSWAHEKSRSCRFESDITQSFPLRSGIMMWRGSHSLCYRDA